MLFSGDSIQVEAVLVATGRVPNTKGLGLETIGVAINSKTGGIAVDQKLRTRVPNVFAAGDCTGE